MKNISEILKNAPKGILLYSPVFGHVNLVGVTDKVGARDKIIANIQFGKSGNVEFDSFGRYRVDGECMLFPSKFHKTWDDWQESLLSSGDFITNIDGYKETFVIYKVFGRDTCEAYDSKGSNTMISRIEYRWATDEEKNGFLAELGRNGYFWDENDCQIKMKMSDSNKEEVSNLHNYLYNEDTRVNKLEIDNYRLTALVLLIAKHNLTKKEIEDSLNMLSKANTIKEIDAVSDNISKLYGLTYIDDAAKTLIEQQANIEENTPTFKIGDIVRIKERSGDEDDCEIIVISLMKCSGLSEVFTKSRV